jgi:hypothetical protein
MKLEPSISRCLQTLASFQRHSLDLSPPPPPVACESSFLYYLLDFEHSGGAHRLHFQFRGWKQSSANTLVCMYQTGPCDNVADGAVTAVRKSDLKEFVMLQAGDTQLDTMLEG